MFFRSPIVRFFNRILNRVTITVVLVALQLLWLCWVFYSITTGTGRVWVNGLLNALSLLIILYLVRKDENSAYKVGWIALIGILPLLGGALYLAFGNKRPGKRLSLKMHAVDSAHKKDLQQQPGRTGQSGCRRAGPEPLCGKVWPLSGMAEHPCAVFCQRRSNVSAAAGRSGKGPKEHLSGIFHREPWLHVEWHREGPAPQGGTGRGCASDLR